MAENIGLRFNLVAKLMKMRYGDCLRIERDDVMKAWPPTGDHDRSMEGAFRAMSLSNSGNRPEESYTTDERIENDLDGSFKFDRQPLDGSYVFNRRLAACPKCEGRGTIKKWPSLASERFDPNASVDMNATVQAVIIQCDHTP